MKAVTAYDYLCIRCFKASKATLLCSSCLSLTRWRMLPTSNCMLRMKETSKTKALMKLSKTSLPLRSR